MYCEQCGSLITDDSVFCPNCGANVGQSGSPDPSQEPAQFCPNCGAPLKEEDVFCVACGARVPADGEPVGAETVHKEPDRAKKRPPTWVFLVVGLVVFALIGGGAGWLIGHNRQDEGAKTAEVTEEESAENEEPAAIEEEESDEDDDSYGDDSYDDDSYDGDDYEDDDYDESKSEDDSDDVYWMDRDEIMPETATRVLSDEEVEELAQDPQKLNYVKNEIYARHHYIFQKSEMRNYFGDKDWYSGYYSSDQSAEAEFNSYERQNKEKLAAKENSPGYPKYQPAP